MQEGNARLLRDWLMISPRWRYRVFNSPLSICSSSNCEKAKTFSLEILPYSIAICVTFTFPELMGLEVSKII
jgi:hypothetical protein